ALCHDVNLFGHNMCRSSRPCITTYRLLSSLFQSMATTLLIPVANFLPSFLVRFILFASNCHILAYSSNSGQGSSPAKPGVPPGVLTKSWQAFDGAPNGIYRCPL